MAEEDTPTEGAIPPKQTPTASPAASSPIQRKAVITRKPTLRKPGETVSAPAVPPPPAAPATPAPAAPSTPAPQGIAIPREEAAKKMTARISLASATGQIPSVAIPPATDDVKTIKLKSPTATQSVSPQESAAIAAQAAKSKTSRISLESALSTQPELPPASNAAPKTIRLKRPTEMGGAPAKPALKPPTTHIQIPQPPHQTGQIPPAAVATPPPEPEQESPDNSPTRKKTIKVKRPGAGGGPKISLNKSGEGEEGAAAVGDDNLQQLSGFDNLTPIAAPDKVNPIFIVAAVIAIIMAIDLIWVLAAQLFGPNAAVADYATPQGPDVPNPPFALTVD